MATSREIKIDEFIEQLKKENAHHCDVHYHLEPDGKCRCGTQATLLSLIAARLIEYLLQ